MHDRRVSGQLRAKILVDLALLVACGVGRTCG